MFLRLPVGHISCVLSTQEFGASGLVVMIARGVNHESHVYSTEIDEHESKVHTCATC
jgi:hypothetical protein